MTCYVMYDEQRKPVGHICAELGEHCSDCGYLGTNLCDFPVGEGKTCDHCICDYHGKKIAQNMHYCEQHYEEWQAFRDSGGVKKELENVVPFRGA